MASSFESILPAIIGAGMMKGILAILTVTGWVSSYLDSPYPGLEFIQQD